jgi:hypothetical protein
VPVEEFLHDIEPVTAVPVEEFLHDIKGGSLRSPPTAVCGRPQAAVLAGRRGGHDGPTRR